MVIDHVGYLLFPNILALRWVGRISMPLFAFTVAEGCRYTKNKINHFALIFILGVICQIVFFFFSDGSLNMSILITFSLSIALIYCMQYFKKCLFTRAKVFDTVLAGLLFAASVFAIYAINCVRYRDFIIDYGFWGTMLPVFAALFDFRGIALPEKLKFLDNHYIRLLAFAIGLVLLCLLADIDSKYNQWYSLIALVPLALYNGAKGRFNLKYLFYVFYPLHLLILEGIAFLL